MLGKLPVVVKYTKEYPAKPPGGAAKLNVLVVHEVTLIELNGYDPSMSLLMDAIAVAWFVELLLTQLVTIGWKNAAPGVDPAGKSGPLFMFAPPT